MRFLITGTSGFIGGALAEQLKEHELTQLDDICNVKGWDRLISGMIENGRFDAVFHIGACSDTQNSDVAYMMTRNVEFTFVIADVCQKKGVPLIYSSSASVYGNDGSPQTLYAWSKYIGERYVLKTGGVALRYFNVYGSDESKKGKMASFVYQAYLANQRDERIKIFPSYPFAPARDFVYVKDVLSANWHAFENYANVKGNYFDVGTGKSYTYETLLWKMGLNYDYTAVDAIPKNYQYQTKARDFMPGWTPKWSLEDGINDYLLILRELSL